MNKTLFPTAFEEGTIFRAEIGFSSVVAGRHVRPQDIDVIVAGKRQSYVQAIGIKDVDGDRVGSIWFNEKYAHEVKLAGELDVRVTDWQNHSPMFCYSVRGCEWTQDRLQQQIWYFRGTP